MELFFERKPKSKLLDVAMTEVIKRIKIASGLKNIHGGYEQVTDLNKYIFGLPLDNDIVAKSLSDGKSVWLCYVAVEIDPDSFDDRLVENSSLRDWDFEEQFVYPVVNTQTVPIGALKNDQGKKLRTIFFLGQSL